MTTAEQHDARTGSSRWRTSIRWIRIIPVALIMYTIAFIDRTNISLALPHISRDLHLDPQQAGTVARSEEHTSELQSQSNLVCRLLLEKKKKIRDTTLLHELTSAQRPLV